MAAHSLGEANGRPPSEVGKCNRAPLAATADWDDPSGLLGEIAVATRSPSNSILASIG